MSTEQSNREVQPPPRKDGLADERDDPQTQPAVERELEEENAATSLDQPSGDIG